MYWVDERAVAPTHDRSNYVSRRRRCSTPRRSRSRASIACAARRRTSRRRRDYEAELRDTVKSKLGGLPSLDLVVMGIGDDGHTASLFPG